MELPSSTRYPQIKHQQLLLLNWVTTMRPAHLAQKPTKWLLLLLPKVYKELFLSTCLRAAPPQGLKFQMRR